MTTTFPPELERDLLALDGKGYKAYKSLQGKSFSFPPLTLRFEHVQGDPFAFPTRLSVSADLFSLGFKSNLFDTSLKRLAFEDHLLRCLHENLGKVKMAIRGSGKSGQLFVQVPSQKVIQRNGVVIEGNSLQCIVFAGLPAEGRRILGRECLRFFRKALLPALNQSLLASSLDITRLWQSIHTLEDYHGLQEALLKNHWAAFIADGSLLPRASGISDLPLKKGAIACRAPRELRAKILLPHAGEIEGMAIPQGITLIVGGGFHGKSTLLRAIQSAVYPHILGDGRERIAALPTAVKIRAEDGRVVKEVDVSGFMNHLPLVKSTKNFSTGSASGSTSQAVNIIEAIEAGTRLLLMDEDTCATNFMIRDSRMQALVPSDKEPITPFLDRVREIYESLGISTILVMGGCGDYFDVADQVIAMGEFEPCVVTERAKQIARESPVRRKREIPFPFPPVKARRTNPEALRFSRGKKDCVIQTSRLFSLVTGRDEIDTRYIEQFAEEGQLEACGWILRRLRDFLQGNERSNREAMERVFEEIREKGLSRLMTYNNGLLALPRLQEGMAVLNRLRTSR